ncbi:MAG: MFS transporter [Epsilonproteobacteria bacterium]|nr:MFS transporter [Campylobacterota bacterium]
MQLLLASFYFFYFAIIGVYIIFMPKILSTIGYSASDIGIIFASGPLVRFILPFAFTKYLKLNSKSFKIALVIMLFSVVTFYMSIDDFYKLLCSNISFNLGLSLILPYIEVISLDTIGKERYGKIRLFGSIGFIAVALVLVNFLSDVYTALNYLVVLSLLTSVVAFSIVKLSDKTTKKHQDIKNDIDLLRDWKLWLGLTLMQVSFGTFYNFFTIYETDYGISLDMTVYLWSFGVIAEIFMLFFQGRLLRRNLLNILLFTTFAAVVRWFLIFLYPQNLYVLFFAQTLHAFSFALFHSASISYLFYLYKHKPLAQQFFSGITYGLGGFVGALYAGFIYEMFPRQLFLSASIIALLSTFFIYLWSKKAT